MAEPEWKILKDHCPLKQIKRLKFVVTMSSRWIIPGTEDLLDTWHDPKLKAFKMPKLLIVTIPIALIFGGAYYLIGML